MQAYREKLKERFLRYVAVDTAADEGADCYPSSKGQLQLGNILAHELRELKTENVTISPYGIVSATLPANESGIPAIAWLAHMDTSPESPGCGIKPQIIESYQGGDIPLTGNPDKVIKVEDTPQLQDMIGKTLITTDGTTLLGGDDKAGIAIIMTTVDYLIKHPEVKHGPIRIVFSCDEEIGKGVDHLSVEEIDAVAGYTLDGESELMIEAETFSADVATVTVRGKNIHPGLAKNRMVNAIRIASEFISRMPRQTMSPETTEGLEPFMHPYSLTGGVESSSFKIILRSFETADLEKQGQILHAIAESLLAEFPKCEIDIDIKKQYRNMREGMHKEPRAVEKAKQAIKNLGYEYKMTSIRGGTDGSQLTELGMPTPNLSAGMHNFHSPLEFACLDEMETAVQVLIELAKCWAEEKTDA
ncbi:MAG: peptidase T [Acidobacteria bacterium]|nr:MAG: peptidase T [Acidobacteriota bacterium]PIE90796.1 MAG: peptidase T [Acidobacteriota bacterium]